MSGPDLELVCRRINHQPDIVVCRKGMPFSQPLIPAQAGIQLSQGRRQP